VRDDAVREVSCIAIDFEVVYPLVVGFDRFDGLDFVGLGHDCAPICCDSTLSMRTLWRDGFAGDGLPNDQLFGFHGLEPALRLDEQRVGG